MKFTFHFQGPESLAARLANDALPEKKSALIPLAVEKSVELGMGKERRG